MTLLYLDGFAHGQSSRYPGAPTGWNWAQTSSPRTPGGYYAFTGPSGVVKRAISASAEVFTGCGFRLTALNLALMHVWGDGGATQHLTLMLNSSGRLELRRGSTGGALLATGTTTIATDTWFYVEVRATVADSGGICQVRLNGATTPEIDYTGDTRNGGTSTNVDAVSLQAFNPSPTIRFADWYILNASGAVNNTWMGDVRVATLTPSGNGASSQLVGSDGNSTDNYLLVDELPPSTADYVESATVGHTDTYPVTDLPAGVTTVKGVQVAALAAKSDAGAVSARVVARVAGTDYAPDVVALSTSYTETLRMWETSPATSTAWTTTEVDALEVGVQVA